MIMNRATPIILGLVFIILSGCSDAEQGFPNPLQIDPLQIEILTEEEEESSPVGSITGRILFTDNDGQVRAHALSSNEYVIFQESSEKISGKSLILFVDFPSNNSVYLMEGGYFQIRDVEPGSHEIALTPTSDVIIAADPGTMPEENYAQIDAPASQWNVVVEAGKNTTTGSLIISITEPEWKVGTIGQEVVIPQEPIIPQEPDTPLPQEPVTSLPPGPVSFFADFEENSNKAVPNKGVNDLANWKPENPGQIWELAPFANGTQGLKQTVEGCGNSGNTPLPGVKNFTNGIIQLEMSWGDNDGWGVIFRQSAPDKGYLVAFGASETPAVIVARLDDGCGANGVCLDGPPVCENDPAKTLAQVPHGLGQIDETNNTIYFGRIEAINDIIRVWYMKLDDVRDPFAQNLGAPIVEVRDPTHKSGAVGIWQESQGGSMIDNVAVTSHGFFGLEPQGKIATMWGELKEY